ncbi:LysR substrate-binding domain-containing protein [Novosphingobium sp. fls2-241-R2A-195]|uniref:choline sulfate utilization transcriptional regulator n=1 Tax=Novosphingobium sp. fls2-241-R2A-195 TaxID=3040296 RepID=UPI00254EADF6|nr:LysR substrate-binding domain-containing protein [Novosphingobium sp. fls2-241-R2A-195]
MGLNSAGFGRLPLKSLAVFEAAARHGKFAAAAEELLMTQAGVSQHISQLEADLGVTLFDRQHRGVALTHAGAQFRQSVEQGLRTLSDGVASVRRLGSERTVDILTDFGFAAWWLMPRIAALSELMPEVEIRLVTTQSEIDGSSADFDLGILFGRGDWAGCTSRLLFREEVYPVCSPGYLGDRRLPLSPEEIARLRLLHLRGQAPQNRWFDWEEWFAGMGAPLPARHQELVFNNYQIVLQAVLLGQGVGLGWAPLIDELVGSGSLVRLTDTPLSSDRGYHIVRPTRTNHTNPLAETIASWLLGQHSEGTQLQ